MTSIATGGGTPIELRRACIGIKPGTHLPGYTGYTPTRKYRIGKTYGKDTYEINCFLQNWTVENEAEQPRDMMIPDHNGSNKYFKNMLPGYTGYLPTSEFKFGNRYKVIADHSIDDFKRAKIKSDDLAETLDATVAQQPVLKQVAAPDEVKESCDFFRAKHPTKGSTMGEKRTGDEAPIPGYIGYVPKVIPTEIGLGGRYHTTSHNGYAAFYREMERQDAVRNQPISLDTRPAPRKYNVNFRIDSPMSQLTDPPTHRVYPPEGMVPNYTGYLPPFSEKLPQPQEKVAVAE